MDLAGMPFGSQLQVLATATSRSFGRHWAMCTASGLEVALMCLTRIFTRFFKVHLCKAARTLLAREDDVLRTESLSNG